MPPLSPQMVGLRFAGAPGRGRRAAGDGPLGTAGASEPDEPGRVDDRRDARRELEDEPDGSRTTRPGRPLSEGLWRGITVAGRLVVGGLASLAGSPLGGGRRVYHRRSAHGRAGSVAVAGSNKRYSVDFEARCGRGPRRRRTRWRRGNQRRGAHRGPSPARKSGPAITVSRRPPRATFVSVRRAPPSSTCCRTSTTSCGSCGGIRASRRPPS